MKKQITSVAVFLLTLPMTWAADHTLHVAVYPTARQQLDASRALIATIGAHPPGNVDAIHAAVAASVTSLEVVFQRWPKDRQAIAEAYVLESEVLTAPIVRAYPSGEQLARRGLAEIGTMPEGALMQRALGESLAGLERAPEAEQAFRSAESHPRLKELTAIQQLSVFQAAGSFYEHRNNGEEAARHYRVAAKVPGLSELTVMSLTLSSRERSADTDKANARADLDKLAQLVLTALQHNYTKPADLSSLREFQAAVARYRRKLG